MATCKITTSKLQIPDFREASKDKFVLLALASICGLVKKTVYKLPAQSFTWNGEEYRIPGVQSKEKLVEEFHDNVSSDDVEACWCHNGVQKDCDCVSCEDCLLCSNAGDAEEKIAAFRAFCVGNGIRLPWDGNEDE